MSTYTLANQLLIAMPNMEDPNFTRTVSLMCQHDENGGMGVIINRPIREFSLPDVLEHLKLEPSNSLTYKHNTVYSGGPVHPELGMILHRGVGNWESTLAIGEHFGLTTSMDIIQALSQGEGPQDAMFILGYAGWSAGQLEFEIRENAWLNVPASTELVFDVPVDDRWKIAASQIGIDLNTLSTEAGHA